MNRDPLPRCPVCGGHMRKQRGRRGEFLSCLRFPDCEGKRELEAPIPEVPGERDAKTVVISPILWLTGQAIAGLCSQDFRSIDDVAETAVAVARRTLAELKRKSGHQVNKHAGESVPTGQQAAAAGAVKSAG